MKRLRKVKTFEYGDNIRIESERDTPSSHALSLSRAMRSIDGKWKLFDQPWRQQVEVIKDGGGRHFRITYVVIAGMKDTESLAKLIRATID